MYIKKLVIQGFKSFARKTEFPFTPGINVILGPNGSGKSNVTDALCFVLGRLSIKSMRAAKASNLIFLGTKEIAPSKEAIVEIIFDNSDRSFTFDEKEVSIKRIVRKNGQSIYKINGETKTRQEILGLLAQSGVDPNGFNIVLQGEIQNFVRMQSDERRKIIEEVAGISIYESRKEKSIKELEKTEERLKEIGAVLRERTAYLNNLEKEREAALKHKKLEDDVRKFKKSIIYLELNKRKKDSEDISKSIQEKNLEIEKIKKLILTQKTTIENLEEKISNLNSEIQKQTGFEQDALNQEIANLRAELAGLLVKKENNEKKLKQNERLKINLEEYIKETQEAINQLQTESPTIEKLKKELEKKKKELEILEDERKKHYIVKSELRNLKERIEEKKSIFQNYKNESAFLLKQIDSIISELFDRKTTIKIIEDLKVELAHKKENLEKLNLRQKEIEKIININNSKIEDQKKVISKIEKMDICPLCKSKITEEHINHINEEINPEIINLKKEVDSVSEELKENIDKVNALKKAIEIISLEIQKRNSDLLKIRTMQEKEEQIKILHKKENELEKEIVELKKKLNLLESKYDENSNVEEKYENLKIEVQDIILRNKENLSSEIAFKEKELEKAKISLKQLDTEKNDLLEDLEDLEKIIINKEKDLEIKRKKEEELVKKAKGLIEKRELAQKEIRENENGLMIKKNEVYSIEEKINNLKIDQARIGAEIESLEFEILEFQNVEVVRLGKDILEERLRKSQESLLRIGTVNMRALEVYDEIKQEYDSIKEKVETIEKEKEGILNIIKEIDIKKRKVFLKTLEELNSIFTTNFQRISTKGEVSLDIQNKKDPFEAGVDIIVKVGHGKYFDVKSLSGGEQTMVALSLIFAIQELKPYSFYILDEIDAALDKRNSERLSNLLKKYMEKGQYIVITHNDEIITGATNLFGISMHAGISKVISLKV